MAVAWALAEQAFAACPADDLPVKQKVTVFTSSSNALKLYEEAKDDESIFNVRLVSGGDYCSGRKVAVAAVDMARHSEWFKVSMRTR